MTEIKIRPAKVKDAIRLAQNLRPIDRLEVEAVSDEPDLRAALAKSLRMSFRTRAAYADGRLVCVWGISSRTALATTGTPWLLATTEINRPEVRREFLRRGADEMAKLTQGYSHGWNLVHESNRVAIRWLRFMGFDFPGDAVSLKGEPFLLFQKEFV